MRPASRDLAVGIAAALCFGCNPDPAPPALRAGAPRRLSEWAREVALALRCPHADWPVLAHDAQRSGASPGCCRGPLTPLWRFEPAPKPPRKSRVFHAIATENAVYASGTIGESPSVFALSLDGVSRWTFDSHVDITHHHWPAFVLDRVVLNDDGLYIIDPRTGAQEVDRGLDSWGEVISDGKTLFATNTWHVAGPKTYVGALEAGGAPLWKRHEHGVVAEDVRDRIGGLGISSDRLFFGADYTPSPGAGLFAYAPADGAPLWSVATVPKSQLAVAGASIYQFERPPGSSVDMLVCRNMDGGGMRWSIAAGSMEKTPPILARGWVIFRARTGVVVAVRRSDGTEAWRAELSPPETTDVAWATSLAVAEGSESLIAIDGRELVLLSLLDGKVEWRGRPASLTGAVHSPVLAGGRLYMTDGTGLAALSCSSE
jgi:outer membrane protein assembly factor BamB